MKVGLIRHFKVDHPFPQKKLLSKSEVIKWFEEYDAAENIKYKDVDLCGIDWKQCYSSTMVRSVNTAKHFYKGEIVKIAALHEFAILHRLSDRIRLPFLLWGLIIRIKSFAINKDTDEFKNKIIAFVETLLANNERDILIVSHWFVMRVIRKELLKRGFVGDHFKSNEYGTLYVYERE
jgi:broad specificity phosphatase PhoE